MKSIKKLALNKATIAKLAPSQMQIIAGGQLPKSVFPCRNDESCASSCLTKM